MSLLQPGAPKSSEAQTSTMKPAQEFSDEEAGVARGVPVYQGSALVKAGFIRKVYGILSIQLLFTVAASAIFMYHTTTRMWVLGNPGMMMPAALLPFGFLIGLHCYKDRHPVNLVLLSGFTMCLSYTVGVVCASYYQNGAGAIVLEALILTAAVFISLTTYVLVTKKDFSFLGAGLFAALIILIVWSMLNMFCDFGPMGQMVFSLIGALVFSGYILYDTSLVIHYFGPDDYIPAAVTIYLDIINLFLYLLELLRMLQGGDN